MRQKERLRKSRGCCDERRGGGWKGRRREKKVVHGAKGHAKMRRGTELKKRAMGKSGEVKGRPLSHRTGEEG